MAEYDGRPSSREKDFVDIVVFAITQDIDGTALSLAIETERHRRKMEPFEEFLSPSTWSTTLLNNVPQVISNPSARSAPRGPLQLSGGLFADSS